MLNINPSKPDSPATALPATGKSAQAKVPDAHPSGSAVNQASTATLSTDAHDIQGLMSHTVQSLQEAVPPKYMAYEQRLDIVRQSLNSAMTQQYPELVVNEKTLEEMTLDVAASLKINPLPEGDVNAAFGDIMSFLDERDKQELGDAYMSMDVTPQSLKELNSLAFELAHQRKVQAKQRNGTLYAVYDLIKAQQNEASETGASQQALNESDKQIISPAVSERDQRLVQLHDSLGRLDNQFVNNLLAQLQEDAHLYDKA
ncbi:hypothetical protein L1285_19940 [Pseudoalteromonas sp. DL2-H2.2]|uniref:hypothetical protein n=1 Tax=Pseudoalteromonas sp. DL2-H2.2 TaxID=2908889 RepID=UPI001F1A0AF7|nr:hypothetical protein [Pseudoalteromonas sp. DL2-H2.2]MCF2910581.1 hypothetical protein [Pseudoalteromonas sp. DL2-H2.2]